jgi:hypothetical protein
LIGVWTDAVPFVCKPRKTQGVKMNRYYYLHGGNYERLAGIVIDLLAFAVLFAIYMGAWCALIALMKNRNAPDAGPDQKLACFVIGLVPLGVVCLLMRCMAFYSSCLINAIFEIDSRPELGMPGAPFFIFWAICTVVYVILNRKEFSATNPAKEVEAQTKSNAEFEAWWQSRQSSKPETGPPYKVSAVYPYHRN